MSKDILAEVDPSGPRWWLGVGMLVMLGFLLVYVAFSSPPENILWQVFLIALGLFALWFAQQLHAATARKLVLTEEALTDSDGRVLARVEDIVSVSRGMLAVKPSNGFMVKLKDPAPRAWQPGLWWRFGRRLAVGGVTPGGQARPMADIISVLISKET